jgi:hypothetical protein
MGVSNEKTQRRFSRRPFCKQSKSFIGKAAQWRKIQVADEVAEQRSTKLLMSAASAGQQRPRHTGPKHLNNTRTVSFATPCHAVFCAARGYLSFIPFSRFHRPAKNAGVPEPKKLPLFYRHLPRALINIPKTRHALRSRRERRATNPPDRNTVHFSQHQSNRSRVAFHLAPST